MVRNKSNVSIKILTSLEDQIKDSVLPKIDD